MTAAITSAEALRLARLQTARLCPSCGSPLRSEPWPKVSGSGDGGSWCQDGWHSTIEPALARWVEAVLGTDAIKPPFRWAADGTLLIFYNAASPTEVRTLAAALLRAADEAEGKG